MTKFRDYDVEDTMESVARALAGGSPPRSRDELGEALLVGLSDLEPWGSIREAHDQNRKS